VLVVCSAQAFLLPGGTNAVAPFLDYGNQVKAALDGILQSLGDSDPIPLFPEYIEDITLPWEVLLRPIIGENATSPLTGTVTIKAPGLKLQPGAQCNNASLELIGVVQPLKINIVSASIPAAGIVGEYAVDATLLGLIPIRGQGPFFVGIDLEAGIKDSALKFKLGSNNGTMTKFDYILNLRGINVQFDGLLGGPELSEQFNKLINNLISDVVTPTIASLLDTLHPIIALALKDVLNEFVKPITYQMILDLLNPKP
jgi:hypothetical protein